MAGLTFNTTTMTAIQELIKEFENIKDSKKHITPTDANNVLAAGYSFMIGDFQIYLDEESKELKVIVHKNNLRMIIKPNSDNSCTVVACR